MSEGSSGEFGRAAEYPRTGHPIIGAGKKRWASVLRMRSIVQGARVLLCSTAAILLAAGSVQAESRVYPNPESVRPLEPGVQVPSASVKTVSGDSIDLAEALREHGALLVFYRGGW